MVEVSKALKATIKVMKAIKFGFCKAFVIFEFE